MLKNGLLVYWKLDDSSWADSSGNNNTLINNGGVTTTTGILNGGASFDGDNSKYLSLNGNQFNFGTNDFSMSFWIYDYGTSATNPAVFSNKIDQFDSGNSTAIWAINGQLSLYTNGVSVGQIIGGTYTLNSWHHICVNVASGIINFYIDGELTNYQELGTLINFSYDGFYMGTSWDGINGTFNGLVDEVAIWNRAITYGDIVKLYNNGGGYEIPLSTNNAIQPSVLVSYKVGALPIPKNPNNPAIKNILLAQNTNFPLILQARASVSYEDGLYGKRYDLYFPFNGGADAFEATIQRSTGTDSIHGDEESTVNFNSFTSSDKNLDPPNNYEYYSWQWLGYFKAPYTDNFTFTLNSDDYSQMWIGDLAKSGFNDSNFFISQTSGGNSISLIGGQYYPIRIQFGEYSGGDFITLSYSSSTESNVTNFQNKFYHKTHQDFIPSNIVPVKDGSSPYNAGDSAYQIKTDYPSSTDGLYWIKNANINNGEAFQIYADMTTLGGGWTLILNNHSYVGWTFANAISANVLTPPSDPTTVTDNYSIIAWADYIKKSPVNFDYMFDAESRGYNGAAYTALSAYSFIEQPAGQPRGDALQNTNGWRKNISEISRFSRLANTLQDPLTGVWDYNVNGIEFRMPYWTNEDIGHALITTNGSDGGWWGTLVSNNWNPVAPWQGNYDQGNNIEAYPTAIWYWVR